MNILKPLKIAGICVLSIAILLSLYICFMLGGLDYTTYPDKKASSWVCDDPPIEVNYSHSATEANMDWEGERIPIFLGMQSKVINVYRLVPGQDGLREENVLFAGYWHYDGENMVVEISEDNFFNGAYTELVFVPQ